MGLVTQLSKGKKEKKFNSQWKETFFSIGETVFYKYFLSLKSWFQLVMRGLRHSTE